MPRTFPACGAALLVAGTMWLALDSGAARAEDGDIQLAEEMRVRTVDLDLAAPADQATLRHRVRLAARKVCAKISNGEALTTDAFIVCYADAVHNALGEADQRIAAAQAATRLAEGTVRTGR